MRWNKMVRAMMLVASVATPACIPFEEEVTETAPPPTPQEVVTAAPYPGAIWVQGHWRWNGTTHVWEPGYWQAPRTGYTWENQQWQQRGSRWVYVPGHWRRM